VVDGGEQPDHLERRPLVPIVESDGHGDIVKRVARIMKQADARGLSVQALGDGGIFIFVDCEARGR
jgi:hypothetical protein